MKRDEMVTFTEEILNGKLHFLCSASHEAVLLPAKTLLESQNPVDTRRFNVYKTSIRCRRRRMDVL